MNQVGNEAIHISTKYTVQLEPLYFEWDKFIPTLEKEFLDILNEMLCCNSQHQPFNPNENRFIPYRNREPYNNFRQGINNRTQRLTTPSPTITHRLCVTNSNMFPQKSYHS